MPGLSYAFQWATIFLLNAARSWHLLRIVWPARYTLSNYPVAQVLTESSMLDLRTPRSTKIVFKAPYQSIG